jgi:hypothetical protein
MIISVQGIDQAVIVFIEAGNFPVQFHSRSVQA